jgi:hypothetical protein
MGWDGMGWIKNLLGDARALGLLMSHYRSKELFSVVLRAGGALL